MEPIAAYADTVLRDVRNRKMFNLDDIVRFCLVALYTGGHVLLEGNPGLGKTELVKTLSAVLNLPFGRIQFTPDLMPADITGTVMPAFDNPAVQAWQFRAGPIFRSLLLADEINRATPKTQAAMLEAMAERQVTVLGTTHELPFPFMVLATQNPIDREGTYNLPKAQADRFMFKLLMPVPHAPQLQSIVDARAEPFDPQRKTVPDNIALDATEAAKRQRGYGAQISAVKIVPIVATHISNMFVGSNRLFREVKDLDKAQQDKLEATAKRMDYGLGPRAAIGLTLATKAWAAMFGNEQIEGQSQYRALAQVAMPVLRHRLNFNIEEAYTQRSNGTGATDEASPDSLLRDFCLATAPTALGYRKFFEKQLDQLAQNEAF